MNEREAIWALAQELNRSERGQLVKKHLLKFLNGPICSLDHQHWESIEGLMTFHKAGWTGSVLDALRGDDPR